MKNSEYQKKLEAQKRFQEKQKESAKRWHQNKKPSKPIRKKGKHRNEVEAFQNKLKAKHKGEECPVIGCKDILGIDGILQAEHICAQGSHPHLAMVDENVTITSGCINLDDLSDVKEPGTKKEKRLIKIKKYLPNYYDYALYNLK